MNGDPPDQRYLDLFWNSNTKARKAAKKAVLSDQGWIPPRAKPRISSSTTPSYHKKGYNVLYLDGHALWVNRSDVERWMKPPNSYDSGGACILGFNEMGG